jgi:CheY-like chemotaxis protein
MSEPLVLVVEDEEGMLRLFTALVERLGYRTLQAGGGAEAIDLLGQQMPDLMILDIAMPEVSGTDVLAYVVTQPQLDDMKVMVLTALGSMPNIGDLSERVDAWIKKPIMPVDFQQIVQSMIEGQ